MLADAHHRVQVVSLGAKRPAPGRSQRFHRRILSDRRWNRGPAARRPATGFSCRSALPL
jgi:hypothetical protein